MLESKDRLLRHTMATQAHRIQPVAFGSIALRLEEGWDILQYRRASADHGALADANELMDPGLPANYGSRFNLNVAGQTGLTGDDDVVVYNTIVCDVA